MNSEPITLERGEIYGTLTVLGPVKTKHGLKYRVGCSACGRSKQLVRASKFNRGRERCVRCLHRAFDRMQAL